MTVPVADRPRSNVWISCPTSVAGSTVGVVGPRFPVAGKTVCPLVTRAGSAIASVNASASETLSAASAPSTSSWVTRVNSWLRPPGRRLRVRDLEEERVLTAGHDHDRPGLDVAVRSAVDGRDLDHDPAGSERDLVPMVISSARGTVTVVAVRKRTPELVRTMLPAAIRFVLVGSRFWKRTLPVAFVSARSASLSR